jgi:energy-coupling factor transporter ATP-binding protein EcfA2
MLYFDNHYQSFDKSLFEKKIAMSNENNTDQQKVIINLNESTEARKFKKEEIINFQALEKAKKLIARRIPAGKNQRDNSAKTDNEQGQFTIRANNTIAILGGRGSGKTSFIHSLQFFYDSNPLSDVLTLEIIDPTLVETKGHFLLHVLSLLDTCAAKFIKNPDTYSNDVIRQHEKLAWSEALRKTTKGLCSLDGIDSKQSAEWNDDSYVMQMGMSEVTSARNLQSNLNFLVDKVLHYSNKKVLVLFFDDIDIDITKAWKVLEVVRKYLTYPKIITVVSGDEELLSLAVRKAQWSIFGKEFLQADEKNKNVCDKVRQSVEDQYFQKVLKPENRVILLTLHDLIHRAPEVSILVENSDDGNIKLSIKTAYEEMLHLVGIFKARDMDDCLSLLLNLPLRSQIQLLKTLPENQDEKNDWIYPMVESLRSVFYTALLQSGITSDVLLAKPNFLVSRILQYLTISEKDMLYDYYQLQPITLSEDKNQTLFMLGSVFSLVSRGYPHLLIDYMLRIGYVRNSFKEKDSIPQFLLEDRDMRDLMGYYIAKTKTTFGNIKIFGFDEISKKGEKRGIDTVFAKESSLLKTLAYLPLCSIRELGKQNSANYYSFPYLLGFIYDILRAVDDDLPVMWERANQKKTYASSTSSSFLENDYSSDTSISQTDETTASSEKDDEKEFIALLKGWKLKGKTLGSIAVNPLLLGRIMTRYSSAAIGYEIDEKLGAAFTHHIVMFLNSVLVEEFLWGNSKGNYELNLNNPTTSNHYYFINLNKIQDRKDLFPSEAFPVFSFFASCPLLQVYTQTLKNENNNIKLFTASKKLTTALTEFSSILSTVETKDYSKKLSNLPKFIASDYGIMRTISELKKQGITKEFALNSSFEEFKEVVESFFENKIINNSLKTLRRKINDGKVTWK